MPWLLKSEPSVFSIYDLAKRKLQSEAWDGVRNYQARNFLKQMKLNDLGFFYHSSCPEPGIAGVVRISKEAFPDYTSWDQASPYFDPKSTVENPRWWMVEVRLETIFANPILLTTLKNTPALNHLPFVQRGSRLSVMPIGESDWDRILNLNLQT